MLISFVVFYLIFLLINAFKRYKNAFYRLFFWSKKNITINFELLKTIICQKKVKQKT